MKKQRQSNIELIRILAIFFVLIGHAGIANGGLLPDMNDFRSDTLVSGIKLTLSCVTVGGVDIFVLISGWFGIHAGKRGLGKFIYQVAFLLWGIYAFFIVAGKAGISIDNIKAAFGIYEGYWFVMAYLGMYILSPVLNSFAETAGKRQFQLVLIAFYAFQTYYSWFWSMVNYFNGYSIVLFCGLYLTARYCRLYPIRILQHHPWKTYPAMVIALALLSTVGIIVTGHPLKMLRYDNPLVIISALAMLHGFSHLHFQSSVINRLAKSCFAVYIIHFNPLIFPYFSSGVKLIASQYSSVLFALAITLYLIAVYVICAFIDTIREVSWNIIYNQLVNKK